MNGETYRDQTPRTRLWLLVAITIILAGWALHATGAFLVPVVSSVFLALLVAPLDRKVTERVPKKLHWLGHAAAMGAILASLLVFVGLIWFAAQEVLARFPVPGEDGSVLPQYGGQGASGDGGTSGATSAAPDGQDPESNGVLGRIGQFFTGAGDSLVGRFRDWASSHAAQVLSATGTTLFATVLVFFLTLIMLVEAPKWRQKIVNLLDASERRKAMNAIDVIAELLRVYLVARTILGVITAILYAVWLWIFGVDLLVVWALLAFLLNYVPTLGSLVAGVLPVIYAFVQKDFGTAIAVGAGIFVIEQVMGNYVDPRVQGRQVSLSSLVVLITLLVWGWIWGIAGAILAVPITIAAMIICARIRPLRPFALMLSNTTNMEELDEETGRANG